MSIVKPRGVPRPPRLGTRPSPIGVDNTKCPHRRFLRPGKQYTEHWSMTISGTSLLADPPAGAHIVYPYTDESHVVEAVSLYVSSGLKRGEGVVLIMTFPHCELVQDRLISEGYDLPQLKKSGQFIC